MKMQHLVLIAIVTLLVGSTAQTYGQGYGDGYGLGLGYGYLYNSLDNQVPYFSAHPPVYYSYPVPRTYGYSPFAYPPNVLTPEVMTEMQPLQISNPYVPKSETQQIEIEGRSAKVSRRPEPLVIVNPYVASTLSVARSD